jgi:NDP-sugar pyrophosphorylase family protein
MKILSEKRVGLLILAGGRATRMQSVLGGLPKALLHFPPWPPPFLELLTRAGSRGVEICVAVDYRSCSAIESYLGEHSQKPELSVDNCQGTGTAITSALERMESRLVLVCNADTIVPFDILRFALEAPSFFLPVLQILTPLSMQNSGLIGVCSGQRSQRVAHWGEATGKPPSRPVQRVSSSGAYLVQRRLWETSVDTDVTSLEHGIMPKLVDEQAVAAYVVKTFLPTYDFGTLDRVCYLERNQVLLNSLLHAFGVHHSPFPGSRLSGVQIA